MNNQDIIDWKIASLANNDANELTKEMQTYLKGNSSLQAELHFIEQFWENDIKPEITPSDKLDVNFYQMLSRAQSAQYDSSAQISVHASASEEKQSLPLIETVKRWLMPTAIAQFATLSLVFALGFNLNQTSNNQQNSEQYSGLQKEISSLTTVLAMSMLEKDTASERLSGVAYSRQTDLSDPLLVKQLITLLARDKSTSVRLAIINSLGQLSSFDSSEQQILTLAIKEENLLVQMELCRLLLNYGSIDIKKSLTEQANLQFLKPEVREFIQTQLTVLYI